MNPSLPDLAVEFAASAEKAMVAAGGVDLARRAEADPTRRRDVAGLLDDLGIGDLDPRTDLDSAVAAAELCRVSGRYALPYPVVGVLLADQVERPMALVAGSRWRADHGDLFPVWRVVTTDGTCRAAAPAGPPLASRLGPFVTDLVPADDIGRVATLEPSLHVTFTAWRILGAAERALVLAVDHVQERRQFGQPLAGFQSVQFQLADAAVACDGLRELCRYTLWRVFTDEQARWVDPLALRLHALDVARSVLRTAQQLFGAAGLCDEYDVSFLVRHLQPDLRLPFGSERTASELFDAVSRHGFESLFPQGAVTEGPG